MKQPQSKLPWKLQPYRDNHITEENAYEVIDGSGDTDRYEFVFHNNNFYNKAPEPQDAEYIVEACNYYPIYSDYIEYVEGKIELGEIPMSINEWLYVEEIHNSPIHQMVVKIKENESNK